MKVKKAVIVAAGWGTRFLPATRTVPKEMFPLIDRPLLQYAVEEALASGIREIILVTAPGKTAIENYFRPAPELDSFLEKKGDTIRLARMREICNMVSASCVQQEEQLGLGHAILIARELVGDEPFAVILPDDIIDNDVPALRQLLDVYEEYGAGVVAVERVRDADTRKYGIIEPEPVRPGVNRILSLVEKPEPEAAPSRLGVVGRYILPPEIFGILAVTPPGKGNEIQLTDALQSLLAKQALYAGKFRGTRHDTGTPLGWLKANIALGLKRQDIGPELAAYLKELP